MEGAARHFPIGASLSKVAIGSVELSLPADAMALAEPRLKPLRLTGEVLLQTSNLSIGRDGVQGISHCNGDPPDRLFRRYRRWQL